MINIPKSLIDHMKNESVKCVRANPDLHDHPSLCETVYWNQLTDDNSYTLHTHTIKGVNYPSPADVKTTNALQKKSLCIINTVDNTLTCWQGKKFGKKILQKKV